MKKKTEQVPNDNVRKTPTETSPGRRAKLTREEVLDAALNLVDKDGFDALSMPRLAKALGVGTMTLYGYVKNRDDLLDALVDRILEPVAATGVKGSNWKKNLQRHFKQLHAAALAHPAIGKLIAERGFKSTSMLALQADLFTLMRNAGFKKEETVRGYYTLLHYTLGFIAWQIPRTIEQPIETYHAIWASQIDSLPKEQATALSKLQKKLVMVADEQQFEYGMQMIWSYLEERETGTKHHE